MTKTIEFQIPAAALSALAPGNALDLGTIPAGAKYLRAEQRPGGAVALVFEAPAEPCAVSFSVGYAEQRAGMGGPVVRTGGAAR